MQIDLPGAGLLKAGNQAQAGRLARTGGAKHREELTVGNVQADIINGAHFAKMATDITKLDRSGIAHAVITFSGTDRRW